MILITLSLFFGWLMAREIRNPFGGFSPFSKGYIATLGLLAIACAWPAIKTWRLESLLSEKASIIAERPNIKVKCNSLFGSIFDGQGVSNNAGTAYIEKGKIAFEQNWCSNFMKYLDEPEFATGDTLFSMHLFTHEVMHIRGERVETKTDCQAIQRNHHVGEMLGIHPRVARANAQRYYETLYPRHPYFSRECIPGGKHDERLPNSIWN